MTDESIFTNLDTLLGGLSDWLEAFPNDSEKREEATLWLKRIDLYLEARDALYR